MLVPVVDQAVVENCPALVEILQQGHELVHLLQHQEIVQLLSSFFFFNIIMTFTNNLTLTLNDCKP